MVEYNPGQPIAGDIVVNDVAETLTVNGATFPWSVISGMLQIGNVAGDDPYVRFHVPASIVRRVTTGGTITYMRNQAPFIDPDFEPDE